MRRPHTEAGVLYLQELKMIADFRKTFTRRSIEDTASDELYEAEKSLLLAQTKLEFAKATVDAETARVVRLRAFVQSKEKIMLTLAALAMVAGCDKPAESVAHTGV